MHVSLIATVLNEGEAIRRLMESVLAQTRRPDEIVIVDGGSRDNTADIIASYADRLPVRVIVENGANISRGRNRAIEEARYEIIAVTDAGVRLSETWLEHLIAPFDADKSVTAVGGFFHPDAQNIFEMAMSATVLPQESDINPATFLPSSRSVAFKKDVWKTVGGYPEWLDYCEDLIFDLRIEAMADGFVFAPKALVYFRPRGTIKAFYKQYYLYARGDGKADLWRGRHAIRYFAYLVAAPLLIALAIAVHPVFWLLLIIGGALYCKRPVERLAHIQTDAPLNEHIAALLWIPVIRAVGDVAKMFGYPAGWRWRLKNRPPAWH